MTHRELILYWPTVGFQILLCALVYFRNLQWRLPFFAAYSTVLLLSTIGDTIFYHHYGFRSVASYNAYWITSSLIILARSFAIGELCRFELRAYEGIWALTWRILALLALFFLGHAAVNAWGQVGGIPIYGLTIDRDVAISSIVILMALLMIRSYYGLTLEPLQLWIATGMLLVVITGAWNNTILRNTFSGQLFFWFFGRYASHWAGLKSQVESATELWNTVHTSADIVAISIWCYALRKPLPAPARAPVLLPAEVYTEFSPALNLRLRSFNDRLLEMLKS
jgi:hypothetical protein